MKLSLTIATLSTLLLSAVVEAKKETTSLHRGLKGGSNGSDNYFALIGAAAQDEEIPGCMASARGTAITMVRDDRFCIKISYDSLSSPELISHAVHGPAAVGETGPVIFTIDSTSTENMQCFELNAGQMKDLDDELWYFSIHSEMCPNSAIRGQILPLVSNVSIIAKQLRQRPPAVAAVAEQARS
jgi:hypothetical protein